MAAATNIDRTIVSTIPNDPAWWYFIFQICDGEQLPTTTDRLETLTNTGSALAHARVSTREKQRTERPRRAKNARMNEVALARKICEGPPRLALRADTKKPGTSPGFWKWWLGADSDQSLGCLILVLHYFQLRFSFL